MILWLGTLNTRKEKLQRVDQSPALTSIHRPKRERCFILHLFWDLGGEADNGGANVIFAPEWARGGGGKIQDLELRENLDSASA